MTTFLIALLIRASLSGVATPTETPNTPTQEQSITQGGSGGWDERD
jgi:hypothetical protein